MKCKVDPDGKAAAEEEAEKEEAEEKIRGKRRKKAVRGRRGRRIVRCRQDGDAVGPSRWMEWRMGSRGWTEEEADREQR